MTSRRLLTRSRLNNVSPKVCYWVPDNKRDLVGWLGVRHSDTNWAKMNMTQLLAVYHNIRQSKGLY